MNELTKYENIQTLKASAKPARSNSLQSNERHQRFECFIRSLKAAKDVTGVIRDRINGL